MLGKRQACLEKFNWRRQNQAGSQQTKREFYYYRVFLSDASVKKDVHEEILETPQDKETTTKEWMTAYKIEVLQGGDSIDTQTSCPAACEAP